MKNLYLLIAVFLFVNTTNAQSKTIQSYDYDTAFQFAVSETNEAYPLIFKVITSYIENGKIVRKVTNLNENESSGYYRKMVTTITNGKISNSYQITFGFGNVYCSEDKINWTKSKYECIGSVSLSSPRQAETTEYSVTQKSIKGKKVKVYRKYNVFPSNKAGKKYFEEKIATIDSRGFFITVVDTEGTLNPTDITLKREQTWITKAKFEPVKSPIK